MKLRIILLLIISSLVYFPGTGFSQSGEPVVIPFEFVHHIIIAAKVDGKRADLLYDPVRNIILDRHYANESNIPLIGGGEAGYGGSVTTGGGGSNRVEVLFARNISLGINNLSYRYPLTPVIPIDSIMAASLGRHVDGLLGINVFSDYIVQFDFPGERFILHSPGTFNAPDGAVELPITWLENRPTVKLGIQTGDTDSEATFLLDFGMGGTLRFTTGYTDSLQLPKKLQPNVASGNEHGLGGALQSLVARLPGLKIGGITLDSLVVSMAREKEGRDAYPPWDGLAGLGLMSRFTLYLDVTGNRIWFQPNKRFDRPSEYIITGLSFEPRDFNKKQLIVSEVKKGSNADEAGFKPGDIIYTVDSEQASDWNIRQWKEALDERVGRNIPVDVQRDGKKIRLILPVSSSL
ncbi:MAG TPA: PDZ domain-containing protein [Ignavibacteriaceae bacterium]|nr:PDZ domain-containing protein [Ignavibacteriaceae bacterium]